MEPAIRIHTHDTATITIANLPPDQISLLKEIFHAFDTPVRPGFDLSKPGELSITAAPPHLKRFSAVLKSDSRIPGQLSARFESRLDNYLRSDYKIAVKARVLDLGSRTHVMGVLNVTPDSFSDGGLFAKQDAALEHARAMAASGADIIDIGGESTRPGAEPLTEGEELRRIIPVIERLSEEIPTPISVDTYKSTVAKKALEAGAAIVNDISGLRFSPDMAGVVADHGAAVVITHIKGTPRDMQANPVYDDVVAEIMDYLEKSIEIALRAGVERGKIMVDPGIGFGKTLEHNLTVLRRLSEFRALGCPIVLGTSRKRFIGAVLNIPEPKERTEGTAATVALGIQQGAHIVRVHDVAYMTRVARMTDAIVRQAQDPDF